MKLDILSMILGGVLWEVGAAYIHFVAKPALKRWKMRCERKKLMDSEQVVEVDYKGTAMGFNCKLKEEVK